MERFVTLFLYAKVLPAMLLFIALFLPFSSCTRTVDEAWLSKAGIPRAQWERLRVTDGSAVIKGAPGLETRYKVKEYNYIYRNLKPNLESVAFLLFFTWPIPLLVVQAQARRRRVTLAAWGLQAPAALVSLYYLGDSLVLTTAEIGSYLAVGSTAALLLLWVVEAVIALVQRRRGAAAG